MGLKFNQDIEIIKQLIEKEGVEPDAKDNEEIRWAAWNGHIEAVKYLCSFSCVDPSIQYNWSVRWAASSGHIEIVKYLCSLPIERGVDPSVDDNEAILCAARWGHEEIVKYLMTKIIKTDKREVKWRKGSESRLTGVNDWRDMRVEVMVVREIMRMKWKIPYQMMDRLLFHLFKMKVYN